jgi:plasmid maintenance system antidote protein VapI
MPKVKTKSKTNKTNKTKKTRKHSPKPPEPVDDCWNPDFVSAPGETIEDILAQKYPATSWPNLSRPVALGEILDIPTEQAVSLLAGTLPIDLTLANKLARSLGGTSVFWMQREKNYRDELVRQYDDRWMQQAGKWSASTSDEHWTSSEMLDTREEAIEYAKFHLAEEENVCDGDRLFTGQVNPVTPEQMVEGIDAFRVIEDLAERVLELVGDEVYGGLTVTKEQETELELDLKEAVMRWLRRYKLVPKVYSLDHVQSFAFKQCPTTTTVPDDDALHRCTRHAGHPGDHDFI